MNCANHPSKEATGACVACGNLFCNDCLIKAKHKNYCKDCAKAILGDIKPVRENSKDISVGFQQQQQQQEASKPEVKPASVGWDPTKPIPFAAPIKWIIAIFTIAMALGAFAIGKFLGGILLFLLGLYWMPPILDKTQEFLSEKYGNTIPRWLRIFASIVLFVIAIGLGV